MHFSELFKQREFSKKRYFTLYSVVFLFMCVLVFSWFYLAGRTFIWQTDGWAQHYRALIYYAKYLRGIVRRLFAGEGLVLQQWSFALGEGNDILSSLHYYVIGDPFSIGCVLVPTNCMYLYYCLMIIVRLYCAGVAFSWMCIELRQNKTLAMLAGSLTYVFCFWNLLNVNRHPYFLNPLIWFPIIVIGIERILDGRRPTVFIVAVFLAAVSNFYFFYIIALVTVCYVVIRLVYKYRRRFREALRPFLKIVGGALLGAAMGAVILLPMLWTFMDDSRGSVEHIFRLFYPLVYYSRIPLMFISSEEQNWLCMGFSIPALISLFVLFKKRGKGLMLKLLFTACAVVIALPLLGRLFNGFAYSSNRWCWALALLVAYTLTVLWDDIMEFDAKELGSVFIMICGYFAVCMLFEYSRTTRAFATLCIAFVFIGALAFTQGSPARRRAAAFCVLAVNIFCNSFWLYSVKGSGYAAEAVEAKNAPGVFNNDMAAVRYYADGTGDTSFYRASGRSLTSNANLLSGVSSTQYYWTISNSRVAEYRAALGMPETIQNQYKFLDDHAALLALTSVKYYTLPSSDKNALPYGMERLPKETVTQNAGKNSAAPTALSDHEIYRNKNALPLTYSYDSFITREEWDALSMPDRERAMLEAAVVGKDADALPKADLTPQSVKCEYTVSAGGGVTYKDGAFTVTSPNATADISFGAVKNSETYVVITGLDFDASNEYDLYKGSSKYDPLNSFNKTTWERLPVTRKNAIDETKLFWSDPINVDLTFSSDCISKTLTYTTPESPWYSGLHDFSVNMGCSEDGISRITVKFARIGVYSFDSLEITALPTDGFEKRVNALRANTMKDVSVRPDSITGRFETDKTALLCFSVPYSRGWTATVDGKKQELIVTNVKNMGLLLGSGSHDIELHYSTPFLKAGAILSAAGILLFVIYVLLGRRKRRNDKQDKIALR